MNTEQLNKEAFDTLVASTLTPAAFHLLAFAVDNLNLMAGVVQDVVMNSYPVGNYIMQLLTNAQTIYTPKDEIEKQTMQVTAFLMGIEATTNGNASYGTRLISLLDRSNIQITPSEMNAFMAQKGSWWLPNGDRNKDKYKLMRNNPVAVALYCGHMVCMHGGMKGANTVLPSNTEDAELENAVKSHVNPDFPMETAEKLLLAYAPIYFGGDAGSSLEKLINYLRSGGYYIMPFMAVKELRLRGGTVIHALNTFYRLLNLEKITTPEQVGKAIIASIGMDICDCGTFQSTVTQKKQYGPKGKQTDKNGKFDIVTVETFYQDDPRPFGHGNNSAYRLRRYLHSKLTLEVEDAIDAHEANEVDNPRVMYQLWENPFALRLHMAHILAMCLNDHNVKVVNVGGAAK